MNFDELVAAFDAAVAREGETEVYILVDRNAGGVKFTRDRQEALSLSGPNCTIQKAAIRPLTSVFKESRHFEEEIDG